MGDSALGKAAEALYAVYGESDSWSAADPEIREGFIGDAESVVSPYLDALLSELPEEARKAAGRAYFLRSGGDVLHRDDLAVMLSAFLLSLRSPSRGANG